MTTATYNPTHDARRDAQRPREFADFAWTPENAAQAELILARYPEGRKASAVMPLLWLAQEQMAAATGSAWLPIPVIEYVAAQIGMPYMRAYEVATFYTMYNLKPVGKYLVQVCGTTPCLLRGSGEVMRACTEFAGVPGGLVKGGTTADGLFTLTEVECLGACANAPMVQINADNYEDLDYTSTTRILDALAQGQTPAPGSQIGRVASCPEGGPTTLKEMVE
ncbi:MAG: NADH-quinone oxidoreductase subunit NuoE [Sphingomonadaceae bacterium]|nr:NADH-quinone oxidoreductase subunit NuoE [Sphingomonadaceae bacterium]